ncbi:MAG: CRISPR-associated endonuclease Cas1 [Chloroflexi bacterium]|nr:CRISPR-associated endonuclease Cas1 [Chloroflexota bacterium]
MPTLYIQEQGAQIRKRDEQLVVMRDGQVVQHIPLRTIERVVVMGRGVQITTALLIDLIGRDVPVIFTNQRGSRHYATVHAAASRDGALRLQQLALVSDADHTLTTARDVLAAKLHNQQVVLRRQSWPAAGDACAQIARAAAGLAEATTLDQVRGYEGAAAAAYFQAWRASLPPAWGFAGRAFHPPPDPLNAALSFGYTLLQHDMSTAIQVSGLDLYLGTFHVPQPGRPSLALDLMEAFRPALVDQLILSLVRDGALRPTMHVRPADRPHAVLLDDAGRAMLIDRYEALMRQTTRLASGEQTNWRRVLTLQAWAFARMVRGDDARYRGHHLDG